MKPELFRGLAKIIIALLVGAFSGGMVININYSPLKFQVGQLKQTVEVLAPENPILKGEK